MRELVDVPDALGQMYVSAIRERNISLMNNLVRRGFLMGRYTEQLTKEEQRWALDNVEESPESEDNGCQ